MQILQEQIFAHTSRMQMIGQDHNGVNLVSVIVPYFYERFAQYINSIYQKTIAFTLGKIDGKKPCRSGKINAPVICHNLVL